ncbi:MAG TPA: maleylpyruvate isomerase family mycothiol-dependent enzyme [Acidimicrobiales bacterium]|nr:maleylpyruvate isomerase family mycothiol-dependent enzyme [Acidimicrobiales bacterium]
MTSVDRAVDVDKVLPALDEQFDAIVELAESLAPEDWERTTACPGWTVKDNVAHVIGTEAMLAGRSTPEVELGDLPHVRNDIGRFNELWVERYRPEPAAAVLDDLRGIIAERRAALAAMSRADFDADAMTPAGPASYGRFMRIRVMDMWMHEQDIREALGRPGHVAGRAPEQSLAEASSALGFVVGKRVAPPPGTTMRIELTGDLAGRIDIEVTDRARLVEAIAGSPTVAVILPGDRFMRIAGGRLSDSDDSQRDVAYVGDATLGGDFVTNLPFMI